MVLFGFAAETIKPTALVLNVFVSSVVAWRFYRAGHLSWRLLMPFAIASVPTALVGGYLTLPTTIFNRLLGVLLLIAAVPFLVRREFAPAPVTAPRLPVAIIAGAIMGLLSGLTGVGGGILILPLFLYCSWATPRVAAALAGVFVLINSAAALVGHLGAIRSLPPGLSAYVLVAVLGGFVGAQLGSLHLPASAIYRVLGLLLLVSSIKLLLA
jgi:uncharacterized membrane protein YfcA